MVKCVNFNSRAKCRLCLLVKNHLNLTIACLLRRTFGRCIVIIIIIFLDKIVYIRVQEACQRLIISIYILYKFL